MNHRKVFHCFCRLLQKGVKLEIHGSLEQILRRDGPKIWTCNHPTNFDPCYIYTKLDDPILLVMQWGFDLPFVGNVLRGCQFISVPEYGCKGRREAFDMARGWLLRGRSVFVMPEGKLSDPRGLQGHSGIKSGAIRLSEAADAPIIPIGIHHSGFILRKCISWKGQSDLIRLALGGRTTICVGNHFYTSQMITHAAARFYLANQLAALS
jgi:1-acyl-sn-glycerol-3-phosphate acyltransferase